MGSVAKVMVVGFGVRNLFRWNTEFIPLEYGIYSAGNGINSVLQNRYTITCTT